MPWQKTKERLAEAAVIAGGLVVLVAMCMLIFTVGMFAKNALHVMTAQNAPVACPK